MITAKTATPPAPFAARLAAKARALAKARLAIRRNGWRSARLLWPLFGDK